jgi:leucyl-tRNA synthetase
MAQSHEHFQADTLEKKWQKYWEDENIYQTADHVSGKENYFVLSEFSYPSGNLHVGHWYAFALPDMYARYMRMKGYNLLYPTGFDAFGLPAENAAIKRGADPKKWTWEHMEQMRKQLKTMGASFDWSREVVTADPQYYQWTQKMFLEFMRHDFVYRDITKVNWCDSCKTILANEQVVSGTCERCGSDVQQKDMPQWMLRITAFADDLVDDLEPLPWNESIKQSQREWIGRKEGSLIPFTIDDEVVEVFTTRADTLYGVCYLVLAPEHNLIKEKESSIENLNEVNEYIATVAKKSDLERQQSKEKTGVRVEGVSAIHPLTKKEIPVYIADYVLGNVGTGAVMAVPAHDERDYEFALKFGIDPREHIVVIQKTTTYDSLNNEEKRRDAYASHASQKSIFESYGADTREGILVNSGEYDLLESHKARTILTEKAGGRTTTTYRLRDWGISRQRYWGCPIPIVYDPEGNAHPVPDEHLPWILPTDVDHTPDGTAPLARSEELLKRTEAIFGKGWRPEVDTMDTFVDSSWYFYRYLDPHNNDEFASPEKRDLWMPVDTYFGGAEHTTMHLLYSRFWTKALKRIGMVKHTEPYINRFNRGLILGPDGAKMSKSKGNVIDPDEVVAYVGADTVRAYLAFIGPFNEPGNYPWDPNGVVGIRRFLDRVYRLQEIVSDTSPESITQSLHRLIQKVGEDIERLKYNTALSAMMSFVNDVEKAKIIAKEDYQTLLQLLAPFAPHLTEELWFATGNTTSIHLSSWPEYNESYLKEDTQTLAIQVNGKLRSEIQCAKNITQEVLEEMVLAQSDIQKWIEGKEIKKVIYVPGKIVNIVV